MYRIATIASLATGALAGTIIWDGSFSNYATASSFDQWSWASQVGNYQWYIHGSGATSEYLALDPSYKNPASSESHGLRVTIDGTSHWNGQTMERTELIPQTTQNLGVGNLFYHFSISRDSTLPPETNEHQILFFESHFTEMKYGVSPNSTYLEWHVTGQPQWGTPFNAGEWLNFAYDIDFSANTVGLWASTGSNPLVKVHQNVAASTSTNSEDFHVGVLRLQSDNTAENFYLSGVYIEQAPITTSVGTGSGGSTGGSGSTTSSKPSSTSSGGTPTTSKAPSTTSAASGPAQTKYGQCGGTGWTGPTTCASGSTCTAVSPPYYSQCL